MCSSNWRFCVQNLRNGVAEYFCRQAYAGRGLGTGLHPELHSSVPLQSLNGYEPAASEGQAPAPRACLHRSHARRPAVPLQELDEGVHLGHLGHLTSESSKEYKSHRHMTLRPAFERAMLCSALARHWDGQSAWHRGTLAGPGPASPLGCDRLCQDVSDPASLSHLRKRRSDCRWQWGPDSSIHGWRGPGR